MRSSKFFVAMLALVAIAFSAGCGGSGHGYTAPNDPLVITSSSLPSAQSGDLIDFDIPIGGGCGGPYVVEVIDGALPRGVGTVDGPVTRLEGYVLEDGIFPFTIKITDTSCTPFFTVTQAYVWEISVGPVQIVAASPSIIPNADYDDNQKYGDIDALETVVFSTFVAYDLIAAGGVAPYTCSVIDDPNDPDDGPLPLGVGMAPSSCSLVGAPNQVLPGGVPFRLTFRVTDAVGNTAERKLQWKIDTPPIIISNPSLANGKAGTSFSDSIQIVDGVPPFAFELTDNAPDDDGDPDTTDNVNDNIDFPPGMTPQILGWVEVGLDFQLSNTGPAIDNARLNANTGRVTYPLETDDGPNYGPFPSEGLYMRETGAGAGSFFGVPRRRGTFTMYVHAYSTLVPNERGQHAFKALSHTIAPSEPPTGTTPAFDMNPSFTLEGAFNPAAPHGTLAEAEVTVVYNPDALSGHPAPGLKLLGDGGVQQDGYIDAPHEADRFLDPTEIPGEYTWAYNPITPLPAMGLFPALGNGVFGTDDPNNLVRSSARPVEFTISDEQLPLSVRAADTTVSRQFNISVGPDLVIITESTQSFTGTTHTSTADTNMHDNSMKIRRFEVLGSSGSVSNLGNSDLPDTHAVPSTAGVGDLGELLSGVSPGDSTLDLLRPVINPGGWWDDQGNMNPKAARAHIGVDRNTGLTYYQANGNYNSGGGWQSSVSSAELPMTPTIAHDPAAGIYADGGKLYFFESNNRFGAFVVRRNSRVYVPFAMQKGSYGFYRFGDGIVSTGDNGLLRTVPMSVSPDGRFATVKIVRTTSTSFNTLLSRSNGALLLMSLTGEKFANGETFQVIDFSTSGNYMYSTSVVMTDQTIYFLTGNYSTTYGSWRDHWIQEYDYRTSGGALIPTGGTAPVVASLSSGGGANWTQDASTPMQTPFHKQDNPASSFSTFLSSGTFGIVTVPNNEMYLYDGSNLIENTTAPVPFRVSADGKHCALLAGAASGSSSGSDVMLHHAWVASNGGTFRQASTVARHSPNGASRGYALRQGPNSYRHWGNFSGPTTAFEIADDGSAIAYTYNRIGSVSSTSTTSNWNNEREDVILVEGTGAASDPFTSSTETEVTKDMFGGTIKWRFGSLVFTKDGQGLIFWGGASSRSATSTSASGSGYLPSFAMHFLGTYYAYDLNVAGQVRGIMPTSAGGIGTFPVYTAGAPFNPTVGTYTRNLGLVKPYGGFISRNRNYFYVVNYHPNSTSDQTQLTLLGINIEDLSAGSTASGHQKGRGFKPSNFPNRRGFLPVYYYMPHYGFYDRYFIPHHSHGGGMQTMHDETGNVFWMSHYMASGPSNSTSTSSFSSGPAVATYWADYGYRGFHMEGFNADVGGPIARLTHGGLGGDTSNRSGQYFTLSPDGTKIAYGYQTTSTTRFANQDQIGVVTHIGFDPNTGAPSPDMDNTDGDKAFVAETSNGRGGESMAFDSGGSKLFYAFKSGASNENLKELVELTIAPDGTRTFKRFGPGRRYNVLHSGR